MVIALAVLLYLHRRNVKRQRAEDAGDAQANLDFGLDETVVPSKKKKKGRASILMGSEKAAHKTNQLSMDMNLESPYLLPPQVQGSHDSVHTLTRGYPAEYDPYRVVNSENGSIRSFNREPSVFGGSSKRASVVTGGRSGSQPPRQPHGSFPKTPNNTDAPPYPGDKSDPFATPPPVPPPPSHPHPGRGIAELQAPSVPAKPVIPEIDSVPYPDEKSDAHDAHDAHAQIPDVQEPPLSFPTNPSHGAPQMDMPGVAQTDNIGMAHAGDEAKPPVQGGPAGLGLELDLPQPLSPMDDLTFSGNRASLVQPAPGQAISDSRQSRESFYGNQDYEIDQARGPVDLSGPIAEDGVREQQGLGVPQQDSKRLSVGLRPLPPDDVTESEDPEYRANRIRSFYKEYFDDSKEVPPPMPSMPTDYYGGAQYYEDYDPQYLGDTAYFDPDSNAFVMPYAQPVHRRAMTPPPGGRRGPHGPGPRGPPGARRPMYPHGSHGSFGGMPGGRSRAGSAWGRAPSSLGPRPDSSASARYGRQTPRRNLPPPSALNTLPTPAKLKDDSFALMNAADFAPPESFSERAAGRSQSPLGERRPYSPKVPVASPLVTTYDELNVLPSP